VRCWEARARELLVCCSALQCVAVCASKSVAGTRGLLVCCSVLRCVAVCCGVSKFVAGARGLLAEDTLLFKELLLKEPPPPLPDRRPQ